MGEKKQVKTPKLKIATEDKGARFDFLTKQATMRGFPLWVAEKGYQLSPEMQADNNYFMGRAKGWIGPPTYKEDLGLPSKPEKGKPRMVDLREKGGRVHYYGKDLPEHIRDFEEGRKIHKDLEDARKVWEKEIY
jgi:hypothetical protein